MKNEELLNRMCTMIGQCFNENDVINDNKHRVNRCQAWFTEYAFLGRTVILLRSYNTIVAFYVKELDTLVSIGRYSMTTYQHIRKFRNNYLPNSYNTKEINLERVNWF